MLRVAFHRVLTVKTPIGRKVRPKILAQGGALIRVKPAQLAAPASSARRASIGVRDGLPLLDDGRTLDVANVVWCTGFHAGFSWIDLPDFRLRRGRRTASPSTTAASCRRRPGCTSSGCTFCMRSRRR